MLVTECKPAICTTGLLESIFSDRLWKQTRENNYEFITYVLCGGRSSTDF